MSIPETQNESGPQCTTSRMCVSKVYGGTTLPLTKQAKETIGQRDAYG